MTLAKGVVVLEYASEGHVVSTGRRYSNRYISVLTLREGEVMHWRDYLDPVAVFDAVGWPPPGRLIESAASSRRSAARSQRARADGRRL